MISQWIIIPLVIVLIIIGVYMIFFNDKNEYQEKLKNPSWPPTCNADVEAKINELIRELQRLRLHMENIELQLKYVTKNSTSKKVKKNVG
jgi:hypothetical protein